MNSLKNKYVMPGLTGHLISLIAAILLLIPAQAQEPALLAGGAWSQEKVAEGIVLRQAAFEGSLFGANQYLCVLEVAPGAHFDIVPADDKTLAKTTDLAARQGAIAAVNGSFFNMRAPYGSANYLRVDGTALAPNALDSYENPGSGRSTRQTAAVATWRGGLYEEHNDLNKEVLEYAEQLEGSIRQVGMHACATIIGPGNLSDYIPRGCCI